MMNKKNAVVLTECQQGWLGHLKACELSGQRLSEYASSNGILPHTLYNWKSRLRRLGVLERPPEEASAFQSISVMEELSAPSFDCRISFPNGVTFDLAHSFDSKRISSLLSEIGMR
jgi:hypothetical protein